MSRLYLAFTVTFCLLCVTAGQPRLAKAAWFSGDYLLQVCAQDQSGKEITPGGQIACQAYIAGILDYHSLLRSLGTAPGIDFCVPEEVGLNIVQMRVSSFIFRNEHGQGPFIASPSVALALHKMYPCRGKNNSIKPADDATVENFKKAVKEKPED